MNTKYVNSISKNLSNIFYINSKKNFNEENILFMGQITFIYNLLISLFEKNNIQKKQSKCTSIGKYTFY